MNKCSCGRVAEYDIIKVSAKGSKSKKEEYCFDCGFNMVTENDSAYIINRKNHVEKKGVIMGAGGYVNAK